MLRSGARAGGPDSCPSEAVWPVIAIKQHTAKGRCEVALCHIETCRECVVGLCCSLPGDRIVGSTYDSCRNKVAMVSIFIDDQ